MIEETAASKASYKARQKVNEFRKMWMEEYPDNVGQTYYNLAMNLLDALQTVVRLSAEVTE